MAERDLNLQRETQKVAELEQVNENIENARKRVKLLVSELEDSMLAQLKIP